MDYKLGIRTGTNLVKEHSEKYLFMLRAEMNRRKTLNYHARG